MISVADLDTIEENIVLYYHQSFETTERMTTTRLIKLHESMMRRENKNNHTDSPSVASSPTETEHERNRRVFAELAAEAKADRERNARKGVQYVE